MSTPTANAQAATTSESARPLYQSVVKVWAFIEAQLVRAGDWLNPILVKETRQALKSRQFVITFLLVLAACWVATIIGVAVVGPMIFYSAAGSSLLFWYLVILALPLTIVVPYSAFRSLAAEREDNTYDLLSITTLSPRQIITGKLGSAIAQMAIYFSAVAPCIAFTYLLRGVDVAMIAVLLLYSFFGSLGLSMIGLFLATLSKQRYSQIFISVVFVAGLIGAFILALVLAMDLLSHGYMYLSDKGFWIVTLACLSVFVTTFALVFYAAAGMITFNSENRSTPLRIAMLVQQAGWIGWMAFAWITGAAPANVVITISIIFAGVYWYAMGTMLTSERAQMSERVKRRLPTSFLGRAFLTWLNPGPCAGYMFVVANLTGIALMAFLGLAAADWFNTTSSGPPGAAAIVYVTIVGWAYLVAYLGLGLLVISAIRRVAQVSLVAGVLIQALLLMSLSGLPWSIQMMSITMRELDYTLLQLPNPFWTISYLAERNAPLNSTMIALTVTAAAFCIFVLNLPGVVRELRQVRIALPKRIVEDELELHPLPASKPTNPWDEEERGARSEG